MYPESTERNSCRIELGQTTSGGGLVPVLNKTQAALLLIVGFGGFSLFLAVLYKTIRRRVFHDVNKLDSTFDAGGNITWSLTAVTVASQFFWPGDILHSATLTAKIGVAGSFWYSVGILINILLFPMFSVALKTKAPGTKTYLQIFRVRFGRPAHIVFCGFALVTVVMIMTCTLLAGKALIQSLVEDVSDEFVLMTMAFLFGSYSLVGGLGTTFYVSYFNACLVYIILIAFAAKIVYFPPEDLDVSRTKLGNISAIYDALVCLEGLATPLVAERILGQAGGVMILTMGTMAVMSTGSGEIMGLSAIIIYDIYQVYIKPFRRLLISTNCILCGKIPKGMKSTTECEENGDHFVEEKTCRCISVEKCESCIQDITTLQSGEKLGYNQTYTCPTHGSYRAYQDHLVQAKNWCILLVTISLVPSGLLIFGSGIDLNWAYYFGSIFIIPCLFPVIFAIVWAKATAVGLISGALAGLALGLSSALIAASTLEGGLTEFLLNTAHEFTITVGCYTAFLVSLLVCVVVSLLTHNIKSGRDALAEWEKTHQIDNPLNPWHLNFRQELEGADYTYRPSLEQLARAFKPARYSAIIGGLALVVLGIGVMPGVMSIFPVLSLTEFTGWMTFCHVWAVVMGIVVVFVAPIEEILKILKQRKINKAKGKGNLWLNDYDRKSTTETYLNDTLLSKK
ncbi:uncharacterized protein LOC135473485 [Liolophura sinensis]|uniref:uncharacterized protein LOC135473485 n=1 Tax=Liolophura sinensis TaxID=3198878 RepID=UPI0031592894